MRDKILLSDYCVPDKLGPLRTLICNMREKNSTWVFRFRVAEVYSHSFQRKFGNAWQKFCQLTITCHRNQVDIGCHIYISTRKEHKLFSLQARPGTDARRLHYFYGLLFKKRASQVVRNEVGISEASNECMSAEEDVLCRTPLIAVVIV